MFREKTKLVLGRGEVYFNQFLASGQDGERYFGNTPVFRIEREITRVERLSSYGGQKHYLPGAIVQEKLSVAMTTDHIATDNVALWYTGTTALQTVGDEFIPFTETLVVKKSRFYQLGLTNSATGFNFIGNAEVRLTDSMGALLVDGLDYSLEKDGGRIQILPSSPLADGAAIFIRYFARPTTALVLRAAAPNIMGSVRYIGRDPYSPSVDYFFPRVRITPRGAIDMKGDEFRQISFDLEAIRLNPIEPLVYVIMDKQAPAPVTADSTLIRVDTTLYRADMGAWEQEV